MNAQIRFNFGSDRDNDYSYAGWYIDNVAVKYPYFNPEVFYHTKSTSPGQFWLSPNYPDPLNTSLTISYTMPKANHLKIMVFNIRG